MSEAEVGWESRGITQAPWRNLLVEEETTNSYERKFNLKPDELWAAQKFSFKRYDPHGSS